VGRGAQPKAVKGFSRKACTSAKSLERKMMEQTPIPPMKRVEKNVPLPPEQKRRVVWLRINGVVGRTTIRATYYGLGFPMDSEDITLNDGSLQRVFWLRYGMGQFARVGLGETVNLADEVVG
jgi:hypothetical protein